MLTERLLTFSVVMPVTIAAIVVLLARKPWLSGELRDEVPTGVLAVGASWVLGLLLDPKVGWPKDLDGAARIPETPWEWLPFAPLAFTLMRLALREEEARLPFGSWAVVSTVAVAFSWMFTRGEIDMDAWDRKTLAPLALLLGLAWAGHTSTMEKLCLRRAGPPLVLALALQSAALYVCFTLLDLQLMVDAERLAQATLALAAILAILAFYGFLRPGRSVARGVAFPFSAIQVSLLTVGVLSFRLPVISAFLLAVAPTVLFVPLRRYSPFGAAAIRSLLILVPSVAAIGWSWYHNQS